MKKTLRVVSAIVAAAGAVCLVASLLKEKELDLTVDVSEEMSDEDLYGSDDEFDEEGEFYQYDEEEVVENARQCDADNMGPYDDIYHGCAYHNIPIKK